MQQKTWENMNSKKRKSDEFYQFADEMLQKFDFLDLDTSTLRDKFIEVFEKYCNARFIEGCDEF